MSFEPKIINGLPGNFGQLQRALEEGWQLVAVVPSKIRETKDYDQIIAFTVEASAYLVRPKSGIPVGYMEQFTTTTAEVGGD